jgi:hypothetical protein
MEEKKDNTHELSKGKIGEIITTALADRQPEYTSLILQIIELTEDRFSQPPTLILL